MITPLRARDELDVPGLEKLVEHILKGGVSGLFILGTTGEGPALSYRLRQEFISRVCVLVEGRVPVLVGITDTSFMESVQVARWPADAGASAVVAAPPFYLPPAQPELQEYLDHLTQELPLPLFLYNMPGLTKVTFEPETVKRAMDNPRIIGFKDSSGNMMYFHRIVKLLEHRPDWSLFIGPEELLPDAIYAGGHGGVNGGANVFPHLYVQMYEAALAGDRARTQELHAHVMHISENLYRIGRHPSALIKGIKCALSLIGVCDDFLAEPFHRFRESEREKVREFLSRHPL